jgi:hypothetical protein
MEPYLWSPAVATGGKTWQWDGTVNGSDKRKPMPWVAISCLSCSMVAVMGFWDDPADNEDNIAWVRETSREIGEFGAGTYLNFTGR